MGITYSWTLRRAFTHRQWDRLLAEAKRIVAAAEQGSCRKIYSHPLQQAGRSSHHAHSRFQVGEDGAPYTSLASDAPGACQCEPILLAGPRGTLRPFFGQDALALNGRRPDHGGSFVLFKVPVGQRAPGPMHGNFCGSCETGDRPYDTIVASILAAARAIAPGVIEIQSEDDRAVRYLF